jgi:hypothetical protein
VAACEQRTSSAWISRLGSESARAPSLRIRLRFVWYASVRCAVRVHADEPAEDGAAGVHQRALEEQVAGRVRRQVVLERLVVEVLVVLGDVEAQHVHVRARLPQPALDVGAGHVAARARCRAW